MNSSTKIKLLKLRNFKSFKKADLPIADGFTAVIGPNGSGKSNVLDAVMFVLGISSLKTIRASKLTDLVNHNASDGMARVTVHLNADVEEEKGREFIISRAIDKQGKSSYKLDGKKTTLGKIRSLLASLGVSVNGYNFIMQGDVENIIKMSPKQRREIIDEVAGISEYEEKKQESLKQLELVQGKIKEWNTIKGERQGYVNALKDDRDAALEYKDLTTRLKRVKASIIDSHLTNARTELKDLNEVVSDGERQVREAEEKSKELSEKIQELEVKQRDLNNKISNEGSEQQAKLNKKIEELRNDLSLEKQAIQNKKDLIEKNQAGILDLQAKVKDLEKTEQSKNAEIQPLQDKKNAVQEKLTSLKAEHEELMKTISPDSGLAKIESELNALNEEVDSKKEQFYSLKSEVEATQKNLEFQRQTRNEYNRELEQIVNKIKDLDEEKLSLETEAKKAGYKLPELASTLDALNDEERSSNTRLTETEASLKSTREQLVTLKSKIQTMGAMGLSRNQSTDAILAASKEGKLKGVHGLVADLLSYDASHAQAIETAAGARMFFVVVRDENAAINCMNFLKNSQLGRASFIPLNKIRASGTHADPSLDKSEGSVGWALNLLEYDKKYQAAMDYVFGGTLVINDIRDAKNIGVGKAKMVSLEGDIADASGVMQGGYKGKKKATLAEVRLVQELEERAESQESARRQLVKDLESLRAKSDKLRSEKHEIELRVKEIEVQKQSVEQQLQDLREKSTKQGKFDVQQKLEQEIEEKKKQMTQLNEELSDLDLEKQKLKEKLSQQEKNKTTLKLKELESQITSLRDELSEASIKLQSLKTELETGVLTRKQDALDSIKSLELDSKTLKEHATESEGKVKTLTHDLSLAEEELKKASKNVEDLVRQRQEIEKQVNDYAQQQGQHQAKINSVKQNMMQHQIRKGTLDQRVLDLEDEFKAYQDVELLDGEDLKSLEKEETKIEIRVESLGNVNLKALDEYEEYAKKLQETQERIDTLENEKNAVMDLIQKIDDRRLREFTNTYDSIKANFEEIYTALTEGKGTLKLVGDEDPLKSGLLIEAAPGNKRLMNIDALSGGEKTITSMSFLFAIQRHKPAPFYVLDECDAALDKMNSKKLANLFINFSTDSQFLVITHNEMLLKDVDQVIGIARGEKSTSAVTVKMKNELQPTPL